MWIIETDASDDDIGEMRCEWHGNAALNWILLRCAEIMREAVKEIAAVDENAVPDRQAIKQELDEIFRRAEELFEDLAPRALAKAQWEIVGNVFLKLMQEKNFEITHPDGTVKIPWANLARISH